MGKLPLLKLIQCLWSILSNVITFEIISDWWKNEAEIILKTETGPEQQEALRELVKEEAKKISDIDKIKINVENRKIFHQRQKNLVEVCYFVSIEN